jgi:hypothetical protein
VDGDAVTVVVDVTVDVAVDPPVVTVLVIVLVNVDPPQRRQVDSPVACMFPVQLLGLKVAPPPSRHQKGIPTALTPPNKHS